MSPRAAAVREMFRVALVQTAEIAKTDPTAADELVSTLVAHLRSWRPESVSPLGTLPEPDGPLVDPRGR